jgi:uncharacterized protein (DUF362 family)
MVHPQTGESGHVTHYSLVKKLIEMCHEAGAAKIVVGDGSADGDTMEAFLTSGIKRAVDRFNSIGVPVELVDLNYDKNPKTNDFDAIDVGEDDFNPNQAYRVAHTVLEADVIISVPKIKSHNGTGITVSLKNMIGTAPGGFYGFPKKKGHTGVLPHCSGDYDYGNIGPNNMLKKYDIIWKTILDLNKIALGTYPDSKKTRRLLVVVDGVVAGSYDNRSGEIASWDPVQVGVVVAGLDPVAVDTVCAKIMCYSPEKIPLLVNGAEAGLGKMNDIDILGEKIENVRKFVPPADVWLGIVDKGMPLLWPNIAFQATRKRVFQIATKPKIYAFIKKVGLVK